MHSVNLNLHFCIVTSLRGKAVPYRARCSASVVWRVSPLSQKRSIVVSTTSFCTLEPILQFTVATSSGSAAHRSHIGSNGACDPLDFVVECTVAHQREAQRRGACSMRVSKVRAGLCVRPHSSMPVPSSGVCDGRAISSRSNREATWRHALA